MIAAYAPLVAPPSAQPPTPNLAPRDVECLATIRAYCLMEECNPSTGCCLMGYLTATGP
jgi:hypothetical protein